MLAWSCALALATAAQPAAAWKNGPPGNKVTNSTPDCLKPPYSTHDWIADHGRAMLPAAEREWLDRHRTLYLIGTEAPDYAKIVTYCGAPNRGYNDTGGGKHDLRFDIWGTVTRDTPAARAEQEYAKAAEAFRAGNPGHAAYYLGAAVHYIGDLSQYGHTISGEAHHADFELWVGAQTGSFVGGVFERYIKADGLQPVSAYNAVVNTGRRTWNGSAQILKPDDMDSRFDPDAPADPKIVDSVGHSLNKSVNEPAHMLHGFYLAVVKPLAR